MEKTMILKPRLSEKAFAHSQTKSTYVFVVPRDATKHTVARAVAAQYDVTVTAVHVANVKGKAKRTIGRKGRRVVNGSQRDIKKAYVSVQAGDHLPIFAAEEQAAKDAEKAQTKAAKKAAKTQKDNKKDKKKDDKKEQKKEEKN